MRPLVSMRRALSDPALLGSTMPGDSWAAWRTLLIASMGEELTDAERQRFTELTGRDHEPGQRIEEAAWVVGRRGGKSRGESVMAAYIAGLCDHSDVLAPGERGVLLCIAPDQRQAKIVLDYCEAAFAGSAALSQLVNNRTQDALELANRVSIEVRAASFRRLRGPTYVGILADEAAFWASADDGSANADADILAAVRPGLATTGGPLIIASSPYARKGELFELHRDHYGPDGDARILVAQGPSRLFNPSLPQSVVDRALARDPAAARAEYLGQFRDDLEAYVSLDVVQACIDVGVTDRPPSILTDYFAFCDPSGGRADAMTLAIAHAEGERAVIDLIRETRPPFNPEEVVVAFAEDMKRYRCHSAKADRYAAEWVRTAFARHGIDLRPSDASKSDLYASLLPALNSGQVRLPDNGRLVAQLVALERRTARSGKDSIDHPPNGSDDVANAVAGAVSATLRRRVANDPGIAGPMVFNYDTSDLGECYGF
jgi:hypothetical protein